MSRALSQRLAGHVHARQLEAELRVTAAANAVDRAVGGVWRSFLRIVTARKDAARFNNGPVIRSVYSSLTSLLPEIVQTMTRHLTSLSSWGLRSAAANLVRTLPAEWLGAAVVGRIQREPRNFGGRLAENDGLFRNWNDVGQDLCEADEPGFIQLALNALRRLQSTDPAEPLRPPDQLTGDQAKQLFASLLFQPPTEKQVNRLLNTVLQGQTWYQALNGATRWAGFDARQAAQTVARGYAAGKSAREIATDVRPMLDGVRYRARRLARTYGMAIAHDSQMQAHAAVDDLIIGYKIIATLDSKTRPEHRKRNGTIYYKQPKAGQKGLDQMPDPPREADGTLAWNCRCILSPVLSAPPNLSSSALLPSGERIEFERHPSSSSREVMVLADPDKLEPFSWAEPVPGRKENFERFLTTGKPVQAPRVVLDKEGEPDFVDGRHRFAVLKARGATRIPVMIPRGQADKFREKFGVKHLLPV